MDDLTRVAYEKNAIEYSKDWFSQPVPQDIYKIIEKYFISKGRTADIGCGNGRDTQWLNQQGYKVSGYDSSRELIKIASAQFPEIQFSISHLPDLQNIDRSFDNVFCETVIMHLPKVLLEASIKSLTRILKPGGVLYLSWRVTEGQDLRHPDGRLYSSFPMELILNLLDHSGIKFSEEKVSLSSQRKVARLIWQKPKE
jgi:2-polyprenyl-3-methyl-5-hydroxy-6-metoxy-1,4-benzoquinol methylase